MKNRIPPPRLLMTLLDERFYEEAPRCPVVCRLWRMCPASPVEGMPVYAIGMESPAKRYLYYLGDDGESVRRLFGTIVEGRLSPVHLGDVAEDFLRETADRREAIMS